MERCEERRIRHISVVPRGPGEMTLAPAARSRSVVLAQMAPNTQPPPPQKKRTRSHCNDSKTIDDSYNAIETARSPPPREVFMNISRGMWYTCGRNERKHRY